MNSEHYKTAKIWFPDEGEVRTIGFSHADRRAIDVLISLCHTRSTELRAMEGFSLAELEAVAANVGVKFTCRQSQGF